MSLVPMVIEQEGNGERAYDIFSRLLKDRIIVVSGVIESNMASVIIAQLKYLNSQDPEKPIEMIIDSPGGHVTAGLAIYDTMRYGIKAPVSTISCGLAASMGAILLAGGTKGMRIAMPNSEIMIHQPSGGTEGTASDIMIQAASIQKTKDRLNRLLAEFTGQDIEKVTRDTDRDFSMTAEEAMAYGLVDRVLGQA